MPFTRLIAVIAAALWLGSFRAASPLLPDDVWSLRTVSQPLGAMLAALAADVHPPLYFLVLSPWVRVAGESEAALRLPSIAFYLFSIAALYRLCRRFADRDAALLCAAVYACTPLAVLGASLVRMYSLLSLLAILSTMAWWDITEGERAGRAASAAWIGANILGSFCHLWFFCLLLGQALTSVVLHRARWRWLLAGFVVSVLPYAVLWLPAFAGQIEVAREAAAWVPAPGLGLIRDVAVMQFGLMAVAAPFAFKRAIRWPVQLLVFTLLPPLLVSIWRPFFHIRFSIVATHAVAVLLGLAAARWGSGRVTFALVGLAFACSVGLGDGTSPRDSRAVASMLAREVREGDTVIYSGLRRAPVGYYLDRIAPERKWHETSFPPEIDTHPGYEGSLAVRPERREELRRAARQLASEIMARGTGAVYFLHGRRPETDRVLMEELAERIAPARLHRLP